MEYSTSPKFYLSLFLMEKIQTESAICPNVKTCNIFDGMYDIQIWALNKMTKWNPNLKIVVIRISNLLFSDSYLAGVQEIVFWKELC